MNTAPDNTPRPAQQQPPTQGGSGLLPRPPADLHGAPHASQASQLYAEVCDLTRRLAVAESELDLWKPLTTEEAQRAYDEAEAVPLSEERIAAIVARATDPAVILPNNEQAQLAVTMKKVTALARRLASALNDRNTHWTGDDEPDCPCEVCQAVRAALADARRAGLLKEDTDG